MNPSIGKSVVFVRDENALPRAALIVCAGLAVEDLVQWQIRLASDGRQPDAKELKAIRAQVESEWTEEAASMVVNLCTFDESGNGKSESAVSYDPDGKRPHSWHWPAPDPEFAELRKRVAAIEAAAKPKEPFSV